MTITANYDTLMRQAHQTAETYYFELKHSFKQRDEEIPPEVMAAMIQAASYDLAAAVIAVAIQEHTEELKQLSAVIDHHCAQGITIDK